MNRTGRLRERNRDRLRRLSLFGALNDEALDELAGLSRVLQFRKKENLFGEGDPYRGMFVVLDGLAVVYKQSDDGRMLILHVCRAGESLAEVPLFEDHVAGYPAHARATRDSEILFLPARQFVPFLKRHPSVAWQMLRCVSAKLKELTLQLEGVTFREVTSRVARYLLREAEVGSAGDLDHPQLTLALAKGSVASYLGTVHETLSRTFARLTSEKIISVDGPRVTILDKNRLKQLI